MSNKKLEGNAYSKMQEQMYDRLAGGLKRRKEGQRRYDDSIEGVVGKYHYHNHPDRLKVYENLFTGIKNTKDMTMLDFGCGPGRNIKIYQGRFKRIDGTDISQVNLDNFRDEINEDGLDIDTTLYKCNGYNLDLIPDESYDLVMSVITLQHISIHAIRQSLFEDFVCVLKPSGVFTFQMTFGDIHRGVLPGIDGRQTQVDYFCDDYSIPRTNGTHDCRIDDPELLVEDLKKAGFSSVEYTIVRNVNINHSKHMIFVKAYK